jgi:hypothetical protein
VYLRVNGLDVEATPLETRDDAADVPQVLLRTFARKLTGHEFAFEAKSVFPTQERGEIVEFAWFGNAIDGAGASF